MHKNAFFSQTLCNVNSCLGPITRCHCSQLRGLCGLYRFPFSFLFLLISFRPEVVNLDRWDTRQSYTDIPLITRSHRVDPYSSNSFFSISIDIVDWLTHSRISSDPSFTSIKEYFVTMWNAMKLKLKASTNSDITKISDSCAAPVWVSIFKIPGNADFQTVSSC